MNTLMTSKWLNIVLFNLFWIGCVVGSYQLIWLVTPLVLTYCLLLVIFTQINLAQLIVPALLGILVDSLLTLTGVFEFEPNTLMPLPLWLMVLWFVFVSTLPLSLAFLKQYKILTVLAGATGFPLSYATGEHLGSVAFGVEYFAALVFLSLIWAIGLPLLVYLSAKLGQLSHA